MRIRRVATTMAVTAVLFAAVAWPSSYRRAVAVAAFGPGGRPAVVCAASGSFHLFVSNVPTGPSTAWTVDARTETPQRSAELHDELILAADVHLGDRIVTPTTRPAMSTGLPVSDVVPNPLRLSAGGGCDVLGQPGTWYAYASAPAWIVVPVLAIVPVRDGRRWVLRRRRARAGRCLGCGYDLRQSPRRCPECGRATAVS